MRLWVNQDTPRSASEGTWVGLKGTKRGEACVIDFFTEMMLEGRAFQIRAGSLTTPLVGDVVITTTAAEYALNAPQGVCALCCTLDISINLGTGTLHEYALKSLDGTATGTAFVPLNLMMDSDAPASRCTALVDGTGGTVVGTEAATTTRRHWSASNPVAVGAGHSFTSYHFEPRTPPAIANVAYFFVQIAATTTGPSYFSSMDYIELPWVNVS